MVIEICAKHPGVEMGPRSLAYLCFSKHPVSCKIAVSCKEGGLTGGGSGNGPSHGGQVCL